jgi:hypothetical protein
MKLIDCFLTGGLWCPKKLLSPVERLILDKTGFGLPDLEVMDFFLETGMGWLS